MSGVAFGTARAQRAPVRVDDGRFTAFSYPADHQLAESLVRSALRSDSFPGLPRPREHVTILIAPDRARFRLWSGPHAPEWGAAIAFPDERTVVVQGSRAGSDAGNPVQVLRHELAHVALHVYLGDQTPRWFDEGYASYAAGEFDRGDVLATNLVLALRGTPALDDLDPMFTQGAAAVQQAYALSHGAVADLAELGGAPGFSRFLGNWRRLQSLDRAMRASYGITLDEFQREWQLRTRRRYGTLALVSDFASVGALLLLAIGPLYLLRRRRNARRMATLRALDTQQPDRPTDALGELMSDAERVRDQASGGSDHDT